MSVHGKESYCLSRVAVLDPDLAIRGGGGGGGRPKKFFELFRPHFSLKIRRGEGCPAPPGPSPGSATVLCSREM